jgi:crotonobetainyl-CoA:carnitine CoA-transferase CaiB-like acyl-CoA transferase
MVGGVILTRSRADWMSVLDEAGIPSGPINRVSEALNSPQTLARSMVVEMDHSLAGAVKMLGLPALLSETPTSIRLEPPALGADSDAVLSELGLSVDEIGHLRDSGIV